MAAESFSRRRRHRPRRRLLYPLLALATAALTLALLTLATAGPGTEEESRGDVSLRVEPRPADGKVSQAAPSLPTTAPFEPNRAEVYPSAKRLAGRALQRLVTYGPGTRPAEAASAAGGDAVFRDAARTLVRPSVRSTGEVLYAQFGGLTATQASVMVLLRQRTASARGRSAVTRTVDVRLRLRAGKWRLDRIASLGGSPVRKPSKLSPAARRVLANPRIKLPDSARWDIYRGGIDPALLASLDGAARLGSLAVAVLRSGHPVEVFGTDRRSAHTDGYAADIWAVNGLSVIRQRAMGSPAHRLARQLYDAGSAQLGSPWVFAGLGTSFTDAVHQDHLHVQRRPVPGGRAGPGEAAPDVRTGAEVST
ncbi:MAG: hypothetical protein H0U79_02010 [Solirubrobacterales bacterium]|nr:hypothetical protein [Solirubrobacterales bacterium]